MDITDNQVVARIVAEIQSEREVNEYRHPNERTPVPGEMELLYFIREYVQRELEVFKSEGAASDSLEFLDWLNERDALDSEAVAELTEKVISSTEEADDTNARLVALATVVQYSGYRLVPYSVDPLILKPRFLFD